MDPEGEAQPRSKHGRHWSGGTPPLSPPADPRPDNPAPPHGLLASVSALREAVQMPR